MAIRNVVTGGIGLNNGVIGWAVTSGFGNLSAGGGGGGLNFWLLSVFGLRNRRAAPVIGKK